MNTVSPKMIEAELLPCPFCQCTVVALIVTPGECNVQCGQCHAECGEQIDESLAVLAWNTRPAMLNARDPYEEGGLSEIAAERRRQVEVEGWTPEHDDAHAKGELGCAAACYATGRCLVEHLISYHGERGECVWPWEGRWWKPRSARENLIRAGALIVAEIERLDRAAITALIQSEGGVRSSLDASASADRATHEPSQVSQSRPSVGIACADEQLRRGLHVLAVFIHRNHYWEVKQWKPLEDAAGLLSQIDNMVTGLVRATPAQEQAQ